MDDHWLTTEEVAAKVNRSPATVRYWRAMGTGPIGVRLGRRVAYRASDVDTWLESLRAAELHRTRTA